MDVVIQVDVGHAYPLKWLGVNLAEQVSVCIGIWTNIDNFGYGRIDVLNLGPSRLAKEASRCNERGSTYGVVGTKSGSEEVGGCTDSWSEQVEGYINGGSEEVGGCTDVGSKEAGGCIDIGSKKVGGCVDSGFEEVGG